MLKNYIKTAVRNFLRHKGYSFINITGLTIGIASCIVIFQYVAFEYSFDRFHANKSDIYRVLIEWNIPGQEPGAGAFTGFALAPSLIESIPEISAASRVHPEYSPAIVSNPNDPERVFEEKDILYTDKDFLKMFSFPLAGNLSPDVFQTGTVLISEKASRKYFNKKNPIGEILKVTGQINKTYRVAGVFGEIPSNSHLKFDFLLPMEDLLKGEAYINEPEGGWSWNNFLTYIQVRPGTDRNTLEQKMTQTFLTFRQEKLKEQGITMQAAAQPLTDIHLNSEIDAPAGIMGSYKLVYFFSIVGLITLIIAVVNYINLATARSANRAREVGMRKVAGAHKKQLMVQFLCESAVTIFIAAVFAIALVELFTPAINNIAGTNLSGVLWTNVFFWIMFIITFVGCAVAAGVYPAFVLSSFQPAAALKGKTGSYNAQLWLRRFLVVGQFTASVILIGGTIVVYDQLNYMRSIDPGLNMEGVIMINGPAVLPEGKSPETALSTFINEINRIPAVRKTAASTSLPGQGFNWMGASIRKSTDAPSNSIRGVVTYIDSAFASLYELDLAAGRGFDDAAISPGDSTWYVVINETTVKSLGLQTSDEAVGLTLDIGGYTAIILGVYKDFNWTSAHTARENIVFGYTDSGNIISIKTGSHNLQSTIQTIGNIYNNLFPGNVFKYNFVDEAFEEQYKDDRRFASLFTIFAALAIIIASLGLFGLADFMTKQRTKEIGIRKVLGASVPEIVILLTKDFLILVVTAVLIASPVTYYIMTEWLDGFAYRVSLGAGVFLVTAAVVIIIAAATVSFQSIKTAVVNPVKSLRYE